MGALQSLHTSVGDLLAASWGESVTYTAKGGVRTVISALITRDAPRAFGPTGTSQMSWPVIVQVRKADVATVTVGADTVGLKRRTSDSSETSYTVSEIVSQGGAMWTLALTQ